MRERFRLPLPLPVPPLMLLHRGAAALWRAPCRQAWSPAGTARTLAAAATTNPLPFPRAAVAALALRPTPSGPLVLLVRRAKAPNQGCWSFPGGSLELGETVIAGAGRELTEETGLRFQKGSGVEPGGGTTRTLASSGPLAFTASDAIDADPATGTLRFHYVITQVAGLIEEGRGEAAAGDDAESVAWVSLSALASGDEASAAPVPGAAFTPGCVGVAREALARFGGELEG